MTNNICITNNCEKDRFVVKKYFAKGMSVNKYLNIINKKSDIVPKKGKYIEINYDFDRMLHYSDIESMLLSFNNLDIVTLEKLYLTADNRQIYGIEIGKGSKVIYIDANIHSGEVGNTVMLMKFMSELLNKYHNNDKQVINILNNIKLAIIPCVTPDGYEVYNFGKESLNNKKLWLYKNYDKMNIEHIKCNAKGVDVNRNFPSQHAGLYYKSEKLLSNVSLSKTHKDNRFFCGNVLGLESETKSCMYFMNKHYKNIYAYLDMHSQGRVIYNGKPNLSYKFNKISRKFANYVSSYNNYEVYGLSYEEVGQGNDGTATDYMSELAHGFKYSSETLRLSSSGYVESKTKLLYNYPIVTMETLTEYTRDVTKFKNEYYNKKVRDLLFDMLNCDYL